MKISILSLFPQMLEPMLNESILKRAQQRNQVTIELINIRNFTSDKHKTADDRPYGGGAGMVMMVQPVVQALRSVITDDAHHATRNKVLLTSAKGKPFKQSKAHELTMSEHIVIIAGHYEGIDERILAYVDEEVSVGDFVMTGGEIAAAAITDAIVRLLPGVLKKETATEEESFFTVSVEELIRLVGVDPHLQELHRRGVDRVQLLEYPHYTRPEEFEGKQVPEILLEGNHKKIHEWRLQQAYKQTVQKRPDLLQ
ncbi:MAG: tRNA (guanosine(37)-N1)-methyltransferase TrmD [Patescibacteria group bacterium]